MKIWTISSDTDGDGAITAVYHTKDAAQSAFARIVAASWASVWAEAKPMPEDITTAWRQLCTVPGFFDVVTMEEHDLTEHRAVKEAIATLHGTIDRLQMNDMNGEEGPFIEDCQTAIKLLEA